MRDLPKFQHFKKECSVKELRNLLDQMCIKDEETKRKGPKRKSLLQELDSSDENTQDDSDIEPPKKKKKSKQN